MGLENRDYARSSGGSNSGYYDSGYSNSAGFGFDRWPPFVKAIIIANVVIYLAQFLFTREPTAAELVERLFNPANIERVIQQLENETGVQFDREASQRGYEAKKAELKKYLEEYLKENPVQFYVEPVSIVTNAFQLDSSKVMSGQVWRLVTSGFCHDQSGIWHLAVNMLVFFWFGSVMERIYGTREFAIFYFCALIVSGLAVVGLDLWTGQNIPAIGASGAVMAVMMLFTIHFPRHTVLLFFVIPVEARFLVVIYCIFDLHPVLMALSGQPVATGIAHAGHLGGLIFGYLYWQLSLRFEPLIFGRGASRSRRRNSQRTHSTTRSQPRATIVLLDPKAIAEHEPPRDEFDDAVDEVLRKIQDEGFESLTAEERQILDRASIWYKDRDDIE